MSDPVAAPPLHPAELLARLCDFDTPTICNALEVLVPQRRGYGFTTAPLVCARPAMRPIVGYARTATIRSAAPGSRRGADAARHSDAYYTYVAEGGPVPSVMVIADLDGPRRASGSHWGEVNSHLHRGLGCRGCVTDGSIRDLPDLAADFQLLADRIGPSHAFVHVVDFGRPVSVAGMDVDPGDLVHADQHGAVVIPHAVAAGVPEAALAIARRERVLINASKEPGFSIERLRAALRESAELH